MSRVGIVAVLCASALAGPLHAGDWPQFRGPMGLGVADDTGLPDRWTATENIRWKVELPGRGLSNPVIAGGKVFVTASSGPTQERLHVLCFDVRTGQKLWERQFWATGSTSCHPKTCMAAPTPVTDGRRVFALFATCDLAALDADGNLLWYRALRKDYPTVSNNVGMASSPILYRDVLLIQMENVGESFAVGIDGQTGQNRWKVERSQRINWVTPLVLANGKEVEALFQSSHELTAYDPLTGRKRWSFESDGLATTPSPVPAGSMVLVPGAELLALRPGASQPEVRWRSVRLRTGTASPLFYRDRVYTLNSAGVLNCADAASGNLLWQERLKGPFSASPVAADGKIFAVNEAGTAFVVQAGDAPKVLGVNPMNETILATPAIADRAVFLRSDQHLYCISATASGGR